MWSQWFKSGLILAGTFVFLSSCQSVPTLPFPNRSTDDGRAHPPDGSACHANQHAHCRRDAGLLFMSRCRGEPVGVGSSWQYLGGCRQGALHRPGRADTQ
jgi:hypothetical protein